MRYWMAVVVGVAVLMLAQPAKSQAAFPWWWGGGGQDVKYEIVSPYNPNTPIATPVQRDLSFRLKSLLPTFSLPASKPTIGSSTFPKESEAFNQDYLKAFGYRRVRRAN